MFFEIGLVLLMPVILLVARRSGLPLVRVGIPTLAGLSAMHGFVPPHPGPLVAVTALKADLGLTLGIGVLIAIRPSSSPARCSPDSPPAGWMFRCPTCSAACATVTGTPAARPTAARRVVARVCAGLRSPSRWRPCCCPSS
jgi:hypothetical protein